MNIATLFARIGIKAEGLQNVVALEKGLNNVKTLLVGATTLIVGFSAAITKFTSDAMQNAVALKQFAAETGASTDVLQEWQSVAQQTNTSMQAITDSVKALAENREKIKLGQGNISGYQLLGIDPNQDPFDILQELKTKTEGLPQAMKKNALAMLGISPQLIQVLQLTNAQFAEMRANAFVIPPSAIATIAQAKATMDNLGSAIKWFEAALVERLSPTITKIVKSIRDWIKLNKDGLIKTLTDGVEVVLRIVRWIWDFGGAVNNVIQNTVGWKTALMLLGAAFIWFNRILLTSPITWIIAGITLLILLMDDFYHYQKGDKNSFIGKMLKEIPALGEALKGVAGFLDVIGKGLGAVFSGDWTNFDKALQKWGVFGQIIGAVLKLILLIPSAFVAAFTKSDNDFIDYMKKWGVFGDILSMILLLLGTVGSAIGKVLTLDFDPKHWSKLLDDYNKAQERVDFLGSTTAGKAVNNFVMGARAKDLPQGNATVTQNNTYNLNGSNGELLAGVKKSADEAMKGLNKAVDAASAQRGGGFK